MLTQWDWKPIPFSNAVPHVYTKIAGLSLPLRGDQRQGISQAFAGGRSKAWSFSACRNAYTNKATESNSGGFTSGAATFERRPAS
jgi:hypothetical protein